jgi:hypothetical protein
MNELPWWRQPLVTWWDRGIAIALAGLIAIVLQPALLGDSGEDTLLGAGLWLLLVMVLWEIRRRASRTRT